MNRTGVSSALPPDAILRDPAGFAADRYDLIAVGGGIYGIMMALEAVRRGLTVLLLERDDFGARTSAGHLRILHGGLRYLQSLDLGRHRDSVGERNWFLRHFPGLTRPMDCLMPLYGDGLRHPWAFRAAFALDAWLARDRNRDLDPDHRLSPGRVLSPRETADRFPGVDSRGLRGGAFWQDGFVPDAPRLPIELLRWACAFGARALNHCRADELIRDGDRTAGVRATDLADGTIHEFHAPKVVNAAGPWCRNFAGICDRDRPELFPGAVLAWNLLFDRPPLAACAVAATPRRRGARTYFFPPWKGRMLVGTGEAPLAIGEEPRPPRPSEIDGMLVDLNAAFPELRFKRDEIRRVFWGAIPADTTGRPSGHPVVVDHGCDGGPKGFHSVSGVKFTTARQVADGILGRIFPDLMPRPYDAAFAPSPLHDRRGLEPASDRIEPWRVLAREESALSLVDLVLRRSDLADRAPLSAETLSGLAGIFPEAESTQVETLRRILTEGLPRADGAQ